MSCINIYHPDYIKLLSEIDDSIIPFELPTLIRLYQKMNNTDKIPSVSEIYEIDNRTKSQERISQIQDIKGFKDFVQGKQFQKLTAEEKARTIEQITKEQNNSLFGLNTQNQEQLEFHINTLNVVSKFLENVGVEQRLIPEFLSQNGSIVDGVLAAANFIEGTVDIIDDLNKGRAEAWNKLPEEASHWWYRLLNENSPLKKALWESHQTALKNDELYKGQYGKLVKSPSDLTEESIGQLIAEAIKRIETKNAAPEDYSFLKKFLEWINSIIGIFKNTTQDPFEVAAMKILSSDMSDLMTWEEYRKLNNIVNFADILTEQSVAPIDYTLIEDIGFIGSTFMEDAEGNAKSGYRFHFRDSDWIKKYGDSSPSFYTQEELDNWVSANVKEYDQRQKQILQEVRDNQIFFDRLLNKTFRKKSKFLPKTLRKYFNIIDAQNLNPLREWNISQELLQITKKLSEQEKKQIIETNGYTNIAPTLKVLPDLLQKYGRKTTPEIIKQEIEITNKLVKKEITKEQATELRQKLESKKKGNPIVLSQPIKIDGAKKQELSILNGIKEMIKLENPNLKSITAEEFVAEAHNWLETNYLLGFANENSYLSYRTDQTFSYLSDRQSNEDVDITNLTEEEIQRLPFEERQRIANIVGLTKKNPDVYHNKVSLRFNDSYHEEYGQDANHFAKRPSAWGNLTYFYTGKNKWKDAVLLHEIQNDNIEALRNFKAEKVDLETSLGRYLQQLNTDLLDNITQIESGGKQIIKRDSSVEFSKTHLQLNYQLLQLKDLPLEQGLVQLKERLNEQIELHKSDRSKNPDKAQKVVEKAYSQRRIFRDFQRRGGIKSLLTKEELQNLEDILKRLNTEEVEGEAQWLPEENQFEPGFPAIRNLKQKKQDFKLKTIELQAKITRELQKIYGDNAPLINLTAPARPRTKSQIRQGVQRSQELNENVNWLLAYSEKKILDNLSKTIEESKKNYIKARNATVANNFNVQLSKITQEQWANLVENYKYNQDLLNRLIDEQAQKDIQKAFAEVNPEVNPLISSQFYETINGLPLNTKEVKNEIHFGTWEFGYGDLYFDETYYYAELDNGKWAKIKKSDLKDAIIKSNAKDTRKKEQETKFETLKQQALNKKAELEKNYGKIEEEVKQTLEIEMNYFTPLVHHLIQKHINQYGKDFPMYFSGYQITKLTQGSDRTAWIYAGKDEIDLIPHSDININGKNYRHDGNMKYVPLAFYIDNKQYRKIKGEFSTREDGLVENITEQEYNKAKQEYEKAYQQATERRAKEIKFEAAKQIGFLSYEHNGTNLSDLTDKELDEGIKELNQYKKQSKQNMDRVINTIMNISNNKPIETGAIYNAMSQVSGIKLIWQDKIEGLKDNTGGYLVDLSNYNYNVPILYGLQNNKTQERISQIQDIFNENPELASISTPEQYSQYLDTILPDSKVEEIDNSLYISVLNQLEQENIIEKDCSGGGKLKAEKGLQTKFTKGGKWEIVKDLKGYPSHAQGGVDIKLGKDGFSFTGKNGEIKAAHGLVLGKIIAEDGLVAPESEDDYYINKNNKVKKFFKNEEDREKYRTNLTNMYENELKSSPSSLPYISKYRTNIFDAEKNTQLDNNSMECIDCVSGIIKKTGYNFNAPSTKDGHYLGNMTFYDNVNAGKEDMYRVNGNFQVGDIVQTLSYKMGEKSSWYAPHDAKIIAKIETDENGRKVYKMRGGSGGGKVSGTDMYEEDLRNPKLKLVTRPGYFLDKDKLQKERQGSNEIKNILKKREEDLQLKLNENVNYTFRIKKDSPDYNENTKPIMDYFIEYSNNPENIKELVRKTGSSKEEIYDSLKNAFGILGQENKWQDRYVGGSYGIENTIDKLQQFFNTGDSYSQGIAQIKMNTIKNKPKRKDGTFEKSLAEIYGIEKNSDLSDIKKVLPLLVALDLKNKETFKNWGKNGTLSEKLYGIKSNLKYEDIKDYGRLAPYLINNYSNIANRTIKTPLGKTIKNDGSDPYTPIVKYKIDKGSYPAKIWEAWLKNLDVEKLNND